jgi:Transglycosylase-like domain
MTQTDKTRVQLALIVLAISVAIPAFASAQPGRSPASTSSRPLPTTAPFSPVTRFGRLDREATDEARADGASLRAGRLGAPANARRKLTLPERTAAAPRPWTAPSGQADWYAIAQCEAGGRWDTNSGNGYWGGLQFAPSSWFAYGGGPFDGTGPFPYSPAEQITVAERVLAAQGPGAWPSCFRWQ